MYDENLLPRRARLLHVGPPKTGTTAIQLAFSGRREELKGAGVHYAGPSSRPRRAVKALLSDGRRAPLSFWEDLVAEVAAVSRRRVCISNEEFAAASPEQARRAVAELGGDRVHVVMGVRPIAALLPSQWQQRVRRSFRMVDYDTWLREVLDGEPGQPHYDHFWTLHDLRSQLDRWGAAAPGRVIALVSDERDRDFLPRVFEGLLGLPEGILVPPVGRAANRSLDHGETELLRALDEVAQDRGWPRGWYSRKVKEQIAHRIRELSKQSGQPILLPAWARDRSAELDRARTELLHSAAADGSLRTIGDPGRLAEYDAATRPADQPAPAVPVTVAVAAIEAVLRPRGAQAAAEG